MSATMIDRSILCSACQGIGYDRTVEFYCTACDGTGSVIVTMPVPQLHPVKVNGVRLALFFGAVFVGTIAVYWWLISPLLYKVDEALRKAFGS